LARFLARYACWRAAPAPASLLAAIAAGMGVWRPTRRTETHSLDALRALFPSGRF
jgi:hypothetical protein